MAENVPTLTSTQFRLVTMHDRKTYFLFIREPAAVLILPAYQALVIKLCQRQADTATMLAVMELLDRLQGRPSGNSAQRLDKSVRQLVDLGLLELR